MTEENIEKFGIRRKLKLAEKERHQIEFNPNLTANKAKRLRWRELNKIIQYYQSIL